MALLNLARPYRKELILVAGLLLLEASATLIVPWLIGQLAGRFLVQLTSGAGLLLWLLAALVAVAMLRISVALVSGGVATRLLSDLRVKVFDHLQRLPLDYHHNHQQGDTLALMTFEVERLSQFLSNTVVSIPQHLLTAIGAVVLMFLIDPVLATVLPLLVPFFYIILKIVGRRLRNLAANLRKAEADVVAQAEESLEMLSAIKSFTREIPEALQYRRIVKEAMGLCLKEVRIYALLDPLIGLTAGVAAVLLLYSVGRSLQLGDMSPPEMVSFLLYAALLTRPVAALSNVYGQVQTARGTLARLQDVLGQETEAGYSASEELKKAEGAIEFRDVQFAYEGRRPVLSGVNLSIRAGEIVALTGENGAGKSTIVNLLMRLYTAQQGCILVDGRDTAKIDLTDLRRQIGYVPQRPLLFNGTIRANIAYGLEGASDTQIESAAQLSQAHEFIIDLPEGYDTLIGDHGVRLSGGQRQRVALARAFVKDPPILVLDEATSMYDLDGETALVAACENALQGRTVILITHRPASLALANRVLHLEDGKMQEVRS